jgi:hypothetical protein
LQHWICKSLINFFGAWHLKAFYILASSSTAGQLKNFKLFYLSNQFCMQLLLWPCTLHRVWRKAGRTLSCTISGNFAGLWFGAGRALLGFCSLPFTFLSLIGGGSGAGR